jgi:hypothetical protein
VIQSAKSRVRCIQSVVQHALRPAPVLTLPTTARSSASRDASAPGEKYSTRRHTSAWSQATVVNYNYTVESVYKVSLLTLQYLPSFVTIVLLIKHWLHWLIRAFPINWLWSYNNYKKQYDHHYYLILLYVCFICCRMSTGVFQGPVHNTWQWKSTVYSVSITNIPTLPDNIFITLHYPTLPYIAFITYNTFVTLQYPTLPFGIVSLRLASYSYITGRLLPEFTRNNSRLSYCQ